MMVRDSSGHVRIYQNVNGTWTQIEVILMEKLSLIIQDAVSLSSDGSVVAIGAYSNHGNENYSGHVRIYQNINGT